MTVSSSRPIALALALMALTITAGAQSRDRAQTPDKFKWNLAEIYPNDAAWRAAKDQLAADLPKLRQFQGKLASSAAVLADALDQQAGYSTRTLSRLYSYASLLADQDTRDAAHEGHAPGDEAARRRVRRRVVVHRAGAAQERRGRRSRRSSRPSRG